MHFLYRSQWDMAVDEFLCIFTQWTPNFQEIRIFVLNEWIRSFLVRIVRHKNVLGNKTNGGKISIQVLNVVAVLDSEES